MPGTVSAPGLFTFFIAAAVSLMPPPVATPLQVKYLRAVCGLNTVNNDDLPSSDNKSKFRHSILHFRFPFRRSFGESLCFNFNAALDFLLQV